MTAVRLLPRRVEKPWGRDDLLPEFGDVEEGAEPVGEIWFEDPRGGDPELLIKYLFTSEKLSIQVHPDDAMARAKGHPRGKDEAWVVLEAAPDASIGIGLKSQLSPERLRAAARDGSIEGMMHWRPARSGDYYYSPAGTIHALGPGLKLIEIQQNVDLTYRLYDYGRPRELHLEEAVKVAHPEPYKASFIPYGKSPGRRILAAGGKFVLERWAGGSTTLPGTVERPMWLVVIGGSVVLDGSEAAPGSAWLVERGSEIAAQAGADLLLAYPGPELIDDLR